MHLEMEHKNIKDKPKANCLEGWSSTVVVKEDIK